MFKINFYICVSKINNNINDCIKSIIAQKNKHIIKIYIIENNKTKLVNKTFIKKINKLNKVKIFFKKEKQIGIPFARNKCLDLIRKNNSDFSCFVDDDCVLSNNWLKNMLKVYNDTKFEIITGPQISLNRNIYEIVLERKNSHLKKIRWAATNNIFFKSGIIKKINFNFDTKLKNIGGTDQLFFSKVNLKNNFIIWNINSPVYENRDQSKSNFIWFLKRNIRFGTSSKTIYSKLYNLPNTFFLILLKSLSEFLKSIMFFLLIPIDLKKNFLLFIQYFVRSISTFISLFNIKFEEYITS